MNFKLMFIECRLIQECLRILLSFVPYPFNVGLINTLLTRAYRICSNWNLFHIEVERLKSMSKMNGYTSQLIDCKVGLFLKKTCSEISTVEETGELVIKYMDPSNLKYILNFHT